MSSRNAFLDKYHELEDKARQYYDLKNHENPIKQLINDQHFANVKKKLQYCLEVRNLLSHEPKLNDEFLVNPSAPMVELLDELVGRLSTLALCMDYAISIFDVFSCSLGDFVLPAMKEMKDKNFTHIPILENGRVIGVFSENTLFSYVLSEEIIGFEENSTFQEIESHLAIDSHITETFRFLPRKADIFEAKELFEEALKKTQRIGMIFLTETGKQTEKLLAIITPWDLLGNRLWI